MYRSYPILPFGTVACTFFPTTFLKIAVFPGLSYNEANNTFLNSLEKNHVEAHVEFTLKIMERADVSIKIDSLLVYLLKIFGILAGQCGG